MKGILFNNYIGLDFLGIGQKVSDLWSAIVEFFFGTILYGICRGIVSILGYLYACFEVVAGIDTVEYNGSSSQTLIEVFFTNTTLTRAYWAMAMIGIVLTFGFTIWAVIKKMFDIDDKMKASLGSILKELFKSILIICSMNLFVAMLLFTNSTLITAIENTFSYAMSANDDKSIKEKTYTPEQYATMSRIINTIANYSMNTSYQSRYNVNSCYNDIRSDLKAISEEGVFDVSYEHPDAESARNRYWQETLQAIVNSADLSEDVEIDVNDEALSDAILSAMEIIRTDSSFKPIDHYKSTKSDAIDSSNVGGVPIDRIVLLLGTYDAAKNSKYNGSNASIYDNARKPFLNADKGYDVYSASDMYKVFDLSDYKFILVTIVALILIYNMMIIIFNCIGRLFNMAILYLVFPAVVSVSPLDEGGKLKQWITAFIVQFLGVFSTIIAMHLLVIFFPIIMGGNLVLFDNSVLDLFAKIMILVGAYTAARKSSSMITGILADSAGWQSINAGDMAGDARSFGSKVAGMTGLPFLAGGVASNLKGKMRDSLPFSRKDPKNMGGGKSGDDGDSSSGSSPKNLGSNRNGNSKKGNGANSGSNPNSGRNQNSEGPRNLALGQSGNNAQGDENNQNGQAQNQALGGDDAQGNMNNLADSVGDSSNNVMAEGIGGAGGQDVIEPSNIINNNDGGISGSNDSGIGANDSSSIDTSAVDDGGLESSIGPNMGSSVADSGDSGSSIGPNISSNVGASGDSEVSSVTGSTSGSTGSTGARSVTGSTGTTGSTGARSVTGSTGSTGARSVTGSTGSTGARSVTGSTGSTGTRSVTSSTGSSGVRSVTGSTGSTGARSVTGSTGSTGARSVTGSTGSTGTRSVTGTTRSTVSSQSTGTATRNTVSSQSVGTASYGSEVRGSVGSTGSNNTPVYSESTQTTNASVGDRYSGQTQSSYSNNAYETPVDNGSSNVSSSRVENDVQASQSSRTVDTFADRVDNNSVVNNVNINPRPIKSPPQSANDVLRNHNN